MCPGQPRELFRRNGYDGFRPHGDPLLTFFEFSIPAPDGKVHTISAENGVYATLPAKMWRNFIRENMGQVLHIHHEYSKIKKRRAGHAGKEG